jgi:hypothetical protein
MKMPTGSSSPMPARPMPRSATDGLLRPNGSDAASEGTTNESLSRLSMRCRSMACSLKAARLTGTSCRLSWRRRAVTMISSPRSGAVAAAAAGWASAGAAASSEAPAKSIEQARIA